MTTQDPVPAAVPWFIASVGNWHRPHRTGHAATHTDAWLAALAAGRAALLAGELDDLAIAVDDALPLAHYHPAPNDAGMLDEFAVTAAMVEIYQSETAGVVAAAIASATK